MNPQPSCSTNRSMTFDGGGAPATTMRTEPRPGTASPRSRRPAAASRIMATTRAARADPPVPPAHAGDRVWEPPAVAVEHRERVQIDVALGATDVPPERRRV